MWRVGAVHRRHPCQKSHQPRSCCAVDCMRTHRSFLCPLTTLVHWAHICTGACVPAHACTHARMNAHAHARTDTHARTLARSHTRAHGARPCTYTIRHALQLPRSSRSSQCSSRSACLSTKSEDGGKTSRRPSKTSKAKVRSFCCSRNSLGMGEYVLLLHILR